MNNVFFLLVFSFFSCVASGSAFAQSYSIQDYEKLDMYKQTFEVTPDAFVRLTWEYTTEPATAYNIITIEAGCYSEDIDADEKTIPIVDHKTMGKLIGFDVSRPQKQIVLHTLEANPKDQNFTVPNAIAFPFQVPCPN